MLAATLEPAVQRHHVGNDEFPAPPSTSYGERAWTFSKANDWTSTRTKTGATNSWDNRTHNAIHATTSRTNGGVTTNFQYDAAGNLRQDSQHKYFYDFQNRLSIVRRAADDVLVARMEYDAEGRRVVKSPEDDPTSTLAKKTLYDGPNIIEERNGQDALLRRFVYAGGVDELVTEEVFPASPIGLPAHYYVLSAPDMSTVALTDDTGLLVEGYRYDFYGAHEVFSPGPNGVIDFGGDDIRTTASGPSGNDFVYQGRTLDAETGLHYFRSRYYSSSLGIFLSRDTIGSWGDGSGLGNGYAFIGNSPVQSTDPFGLAGRIKWGLGATVCLFYCRSGGFHGWDAHYGYGWCLCLGVSFSFLEIGDHHNGANYAFGHALGGAVNCERAVNHKRGGSGGCGVGVGIMLGVPGDPGKMWNRGWDEHDHYDRGGSSYSAHVSAKQGAKSSCNAGCQAAIDNAIAQDDQRRANAIYAAAEARRQEKEREEAAREAARRNREQREARAHADAERNRLQKQEYENERRRQENEANARLREAQDGCKSNGVCGDGICSHYWGSRSSFDGTNSKVEQKYGWGDNYQGENGWTFYEITIGDDQNREKFYCREYGYWA